VAHRRHRVGEIQHRRGLHFAVCLSVSVFDSELGLFYDSNPFQ
jgi:hypothetical protein